MSESGDKDGRGQTAPADHATSVYEDVRWIDSIEGEASGELDADLGLLLRNSAADRENRASWLRTRQAIRNSDSVTLTESPDFFDKLHDSIMAATERIEIEPADSTPKGAEVAFAQAQNLDKTMSSRASSLCASKKASRSSAASIALAFIFLGSMSWSVANSRLGLPVAQVLCEAPFCKGAIVYADASADSTARAKLDARLAGASGLSPSAFVGTVLANELEPDVLIEAAQRRIAALDGAEAEKLFNSLLSMR